MERRRRSLGIGRKRRKSERVRKAPKLFLFGKSLLISFVEGVDFGLLGIELVGRTVY